MIMEYMKMFLDTSEWLFTLKLIMCMIAGFLIGKERQAKGKNAGVSTFTFVITGAMLFTFLSENIDPASTSRIAAQIVSGIWFLGAWLIFIQWSDVKNLTTAAGIWFAGAIGMAIGFDYYGVAIIATALATMLPRGSDTVIPQMNRKRVREKVEE